MSDLSFGSGSLALPTLPTGPFQQGTQNSLFHTTYSEGRRTQLVELSRACSVLCVPEGRRYLFSSCATLTRMLSSGLCGVGGGSVTDPTWLPPSLLKAQTEL